MYKVIDLGTTFPETGEVRATLLEDKLIKTASSEIQEYWDKITDTENYAYVWVLGVSAGEYYGCNNNGDVFWEDTLKAHKDSFLSDSHIFLHHVNKDPQKSLGRPVFVHYNEDMHRVELILCIDKSKPLASDTLNKLKNNEQVYVSMGCNVPYDECSICGAQARSRNEYCQHLKYNMKKILPNGKQVFAINPQPKFFDISFVNKPADPTCFALDKVASREGDMDQVILSADTGARSEDYMLKLSALDKMSDIMKEVEGQVADEKTGNLPVNIHNCPDMDLPVMDFQDLEEEELSPGGVLRISIYEGLPPSFGEMAYASGKHHFGNELTRDTLGEIIRLIPAALSMLRQNPDKIEPLAAEVLGDYKEGDCESGHAKHRFGPVIKERRNLMEKMGAVTTPMPGQEKSKHMEPTGTVREMSNATSGQQLSPYGPAFNTEYTVKDDQGREYKTDRRSINQAKASQAVPRGVKNLMGGVLSAASIGALFVEPNLAKKLLSSGVLGTAGYKMLQDDRSEADYIETTEGQEIPATTMFHSGSDLKKEGSQAAAAAGAAVPAALGLDYLYNRKLKYPDHPYPQAEMSDSGRTAHKAGKAVTENPATSLVAGGIGGAAVTEGLKRLLRR